MAITTAAKRLSAMNILTGIRTLFPDGTIDQADRQSTTLIYSGILASTPTLPSGGHIRNDFILLMRKGKFKR